LGLLLIDVIFSTALWVGAALFALALLDYGFQRWKHDKDLMMTHQEMREEMKNLQGDPQIMSRRRAIQRQMALNRIGEKVPKADVVVTNPTELAVAIQYDPEKMAAPVVVAKGAGVLAQRIRRLALEHNIPVVERKPLAQLLYKEVDVNRAVPDQSYAAVAEVLAYVYQLKGKKMPTMRAA
jgi:flagellar biosynthetic protein FlhB